MYYALIILLCLLHTNQMLSSHQKPEQTSNNNNNTQPYIKKEAPFTIPKEKLKPDISEGSLDRATTNYPQILLDKKAPKNRKK